MGAGGHVAAATLVAVAGIGVGARVGHHAVGVTDVVHADRLDVAAAGALLDLDGAVVTAHRLGLVGRAVPQRPGVVARARAAEVLHVLAPLPVEAGIAVIVGAA